MGNNTVTLKNSSVTFQELYDSLDDGQKQHMANKLYKDDDVVPQQLAQRPQIAFKKDDGRYAEDIDYFATDFAEITEGDSLYFEIVREHLYDSLSAIDDKPTGDRLRDVRIAMVEARAFQRLGFTIAKQVWLNGYTAESFGLTYE